MSRYLSNIPIFRRLFLSFAIAAVIPAIVIVVLSNFYITSFATRSQAVQTSFDAQSLASQQEENLQRMNALLQTRFNQVFATQSGKIEDPSLANAGGLVGSDISAREGDFSQSIVTYRNNYELASSANMDTIRTILLNDNPATGPGIVSDQQQALEAAINSDWPKYKSLQDQETQTLDKLDPTLHNRSNLLTPDQLAQAYRSAYETLWGANFAFTALKNDWQRVVNASVTMGKTVTTVGPSLTQSQIVATMVATLTTFLVVFATGWLINLTITAPLRNLVTLTRRISRGETNARAQIVGRDEINLVASSMNAMLDNIVRLIQETQAQRDNLQAQAEKLVSEVSGVGEGDLRIQAEVTADALGVLADSFNYMVEELGSLVVRVKMVAHEVENSTVTILDRMTQLVESGDMQINQIAGAAMEVEYMADSSRQVAERAQMLYTVSREARQNAQGGRESVQQAVEGMGRIRENVQSTAGKVQLLGDRSREINNIVEVIAGIAHQTNRLALDAAIQAAMAGENGKGFGAVAADIRRLAERSKDQASMIARIVRSVRDDIAAAAVAMQDTERETAAGSKLTEEAGTALESIFTAVEHQARDIENITQMATQQLQSSGAVVQIMHSISEITQKSNLSTREASQNMERLARLVEQLRSSTEAFKLRENENYYVPTSSVNGLMEDDHDSQMTVSSVFRTVSASVQPSNGGAFNALPSPGRAADPFSFYPVTPNR